MKAKRTSQLLKNIVTAPDDGRISVGEFVKQLGDRSFALVILIFSLPNSLPVPGIPGFSTITGLPILFVALQIMFGRESIWLPRKVARVRFSHRSMTKIIGKAIPAVLWLEKLLRPRLSFLCEGLGERFIGLLILLMASILCLPVVGGNFLPGFAISLLALTLLEKDGFFALFSTAFTIGSLSFMYKLIAFVLAGLHKWMLGLF